jgi:hypothetical protein
LRVRIPSSSLVHKAASARKAGTCGLAVFSGFYEIGLCSPFEQITRIHNNCQHAFTPYGIAINPLQGK